MRETEETIRQGILFNAIHQYEAQKFVPLGGGRRMPQPNREEIAALWKRVLGPKWKGPPPGSWCGAWILDLYREAGITDAIWLVNKVNGNGTGFIGPLGLPVVQDRTKAQPADIAYYDKPYQHHGLIERRDGTRLITIDGNQPAIERFGVPGAKPAKLLATPTFIYSIKPLIEAKLERGA